jgi:hypothetical protein
MILKGQAREGKVIVTRHKAQGRKCLMLLLCE